MAPATNNSGDGNSNTDSNNGHAPYNPHHTEPASNQKKKHNHNGHRDENSGHSHHDHNAHHRMMIKDFKRRLWISLIFSIPVLALSPLIQKWTGIHWQFSGDEYVLLACASFVFIYGGWPFLKGLIREVRTLSPGMMTLIAVAISVAYGYSALVTLGLPGKVFFWELVTLIDIMLLGHWVEMRSILGASRSLEKLAALMPDTAHRVASTRQYGENDQIHANDVQSAVSSSTSNNLPSLTALLEKIAPDDAADIAIREVQTGDILLIKPGEKIPADGEIVRGQSSLNESMISGEARPVQKSPGDDVVGGAINQSGSLYIRVRATGDDSYLSRVIELVRKAQESKSRTQRLADRAAAWLTFIALGSGAITLAIWLLLDAKFVYALERMVSVMVVTCPHALGLAVPLVIAISTAVAAQKGLLIRNRSAFECARRITTVLFDKTGTLTEGNFAVRNVKARQAEDGNQILRIAAAIEFESEHPIGRAIVEYARTQQLTIPEIRNFQSITGKGVQAEVEGGLHLVVSPDYLKEQNIEVDAGPSNADETIVYVVRQSGTSESSGEVLGCITLADSIRSESFAAIRTLHAHNIRCEMATGDNHSVAQAVSERLGLDNFYAGVMPDEKEDIVRQLQKEGEFVAMTGDGVNDAPALARADIGIAVGSGTDVAAETADIVLVDSNPADIVQLVLFGRATHRKMIQNLIWATAYNAVAIPLAAGLLFPFGIVLNPAFGAFLMSLSTVIVALNAQLLKRSAG